RANKKSRSRGEFFGGFELSPARARLGSPALAGLAGLAGARRRPPALARRPRGGRAGPRALERSVAFERRTPPRPLRSTAPSALSIRPLHPTPPSASTRTPDRRHEHHDRPPLHSRLRPRRAPRPGAARGPQRPLGRLGRGEDPRRPRAGVPPRRAALRTHERR